MFEDIDDQLLKFICEYYEYDFKNCTDRDLLIFILWYIAYLEKLNNKHLTLFRGLKNEINK